MHTIHGYIRLAERNDDILDYRMDDLYDYGVNPESILFDIASDTQLRRLLTTVEPGDMLAIVDFTHFAPTSAQGRANLDELHHKGATLHIGNLTIEPYQPVGAFIIDALLSAVDTGETRLSLEEQGRVSGIKVTEGADGRRRVGYSPSGHRAVADALHRQGVLGRNIIIGDPLDAIEYVSGGGTLVVLDREHIPESLRAQLRQKAVTVEVDGTDINYDKD